MFRSRELRVEPVRRYRVARYPSHIDPDPTTVPEKVPFPASGKFLAAIASLGLATTLTGCGESELPAGRAAEHQPSAPGGPGAAVLENPFRLELSGLPHRTSPYGTGVPAYIEEELARRVIERTFRAEGYHLKTDQPITDNGIAFVADGYDSDKQIGYVFADWQNLAGDAYMSWAQPGPNPNSIDSLDALLQERSGQPDHAQLVAEAKAARALPDPARRKAALEALLTKLGRDKLSLTEIEQLERRAPRTKRFIAVISQFDTRFAQGFGALTFEEIQAQQAERAKIQQIPDPAKRNAALREFEEKLARVVIERLEQSVREYIQWARSQGGA